MAKTKLPTVVFYTPWVDLRFPKITNPDTEGKYADGKFKTYGIPLSEEDFDAIEKKLRDAASSKDFQAFFKSEDVNLEDEPTLPIKEFKNKDTGKVTEKGFNFKSKYRPGVFDGKKKKLPATTKIGSGSEGRIEAHIFPWAKAEEVKVKDEKTGKMKKIKQVGYGVSMRFAALQLRKLVEGGGASDGSGFDDDDSFEFDGSEMVNADGDTEESPFDL